MGHGPRHGHGGMAPGAGVPSPKLETQEGVKHTTGTDRSATTVSLLTRDIDGACWRTGSPQPQSPVLALPTLPDLACTELGGGRVEVSASAVGRDAASRMVDGHVRGGVVSIGARLGAQVVVIVAVCLRAAKGQVAHPATRTCADQLAVIGHGRGRAERTRIRQRRRGCCCT